MQEADQKKKKKKQQQILALQTEEISESGEQLVEFLEELEKEKKYLDVQICPKCNSPKISRVEAQGGDMFGCMGIVPQKYECKDCGWRSQVNVKVTNRPLTVRDVELIAEALEAEESDSKQ
jgi:ssDNA-binding Zn-finger/Zn-ribbon topoisomerase 1